MASIHLKYPATLLFLFLATWATAQVDTSKSGFGTYFFEGDEVVFEFDRRTYEHAVHNSNGKVVDFDDLDISNVAVTGNFNNWSKKGWKMRRVDANRFQVRKHLADFKDAPNWEFKFLINGTYWATPDADSKRTSILNMYDLKNPDAPGPMVSDTGNVRFYLRGYPNATHVILTGSFNNWDESTIHMKKTSGGWEIHLSLAPGIYEYKFIVDGQWTEDLANREKRRNQYDTYNSVLRVFTVVHFDLDGYHEARQVVLSGSFNNWDPNAIKMRRTETGWRAELPLIGGKHLYKFVVDGNWITDPANRRVEIDLEGNHNSVLFIQ